MGYFRNLQGVNNTVFIITHILPFDSLSRAAKLSKSKGQKQPPQSSPYQGGSLYDTVVARENALPKTLPVPHNLT
jgi:hypothetical protein